MMEIAVIESILVTGCDYFKSERMTAWISKIGQSLVSSLYCADLKQKIFQKTPLLE